MVNGLSSIVKLPLSPRTRTRADHRGGEIHAEHEDEQDERCSVLNLDRHFGDLGGDDEEVIGDGHRGVEGRVGEAGQEEGRAREEDGSGLAGGAFEAEDDSRQDSGQRFFQDDAADGLPARRADRDADGAEGLRDGA